jgi:hypothetical protein
MNGKTESDAIRKQDAYTIVRWLAFLLANGRVYGLEHKITRQSLADATQALTLFHQRHGDFDLAVADNDFQVEGVSVGPPIASTVSLAKCLYGLNAQALCFKAGVTVADLHAFLRLLLGEKQTRQAAGLADLLSASGVTSIRMVGYTYRRVTENEAVVEKADQAGSGFTASTAAAIRKLLEADTADGAGDPAPLRKADLGDDKIVEDLARIAAPPDSADLLGPEALTQQTIERLQRMSDELLDEPANRTQKGRRTIRRIIKSVETDVAERLQHLGADIEAVEMLASRVKELIEELAVDGLVAQYMKLRGEVFVKEGKLKRHIQRAARRGESERELKSRLVAMGLPAAILENLAANGGAPGAAAAGAGTGTAPAAGENAAAPSAIPLPATLPATPLTDLLRQLQNTAPGAGALPGLVDSILAEMNKTLQQTALRAEAQMETLKRIVMIPAGRPDNADLSRRQLLMLMAELGQELRQPLTVVTGAIDMLIGNYFGPVADAQKPILEMAAESSRNLDELISRMIRISGMPTSLSPDEKVLARIQ